MSDLTFLSCTTAQPIRLCFGRAVDYHHAVSFRQNVSADLARELNGTYRIRGLGAGVCRTNGMSFKQYIRSEIANGLDETSRAEDWEQTTPGRRYHDIHADFIRTLEMASETFRKFLGGGGMKVLESGCGTGRWIGYFELLGNVGVGLDDATGPLRTARAHSPDMPLVRADALHTPLRDNVFDAAFSSYVAEHFEDGPEALFREIHRVLKPGGLFFVVVPFNNTFRRLLVNPLLRLFCLIWRLRGKQVGFTEYRYTQREMDGFLTRSNFTIVETAPDDFRLPLWKGLFVDWCDISTFLGRFDRSPLYQFGPLGSAIARAIRSLGIWHSCEGIFYVARAQK